MSAPKGLPDERRNDQDRVIDLGLESVLGPGVIHVPACIFVQEAESARGIERTSFGGVALGDLLWSEARQSGGGQLILARLIISPYEAYTFQPGEPGFRGMGMAGAMTDGGLEPRSYTRRLYP